MKVAFAEPSTIPQIIFLEMQRKNYVKQRGKRVTTVICSFVNKLQHLQYLERYIEVEGSQIVHSIFKHSHLRIVIIQ